MSEVREIRKHEYRSVREFLLESAHLYPGIEKWWDLKVFPDLQVGRRIGLVLDQEESIGGLLIAKRAKRAKLCSIRVRESLQGNGWGVKLLRAAVERLMHDGTEQMYVTISEALEDTHRQFFETLGFAACSRLKSKYVTGVDELVYTWSKREMWRLLNFSESSSTQQALCGEENPIDPLPAILMSIKPKFAELVLKGQKTVEFRRRFSRRHAGSLVLFYVSSPVCAFQFTARISGVERSSAEDLWKRHHGEGGIDQATFDAYFEGSQSANAIQLSDIRPLRKPVRLAQALSSCGELRPPQSFKMLGQSPSFLAFCRGALNWEE